MSELHCMLYGYCICLSEYALKPTGGMQVAGEEFGEAHDSAPPTKFAWNFWFAATAASTALFGTPGAIPIPPTAGEKRPAVNAGSNGAFADKFTGACAPS